MSCKGVCNRYKAKKPANMGRYASGQKRCQICEIFINFNGWNCPCCNYRLRGKPRNLKYKAKLRNDKAEGNTKEYGPKMKKRYCKGLDNTLCNTLLEDDDQELCKWCQGYHKEPLGPSDKPFAKFRWVK